MGQIKMPGVTMTDDLRTSFTYYTFFIILYLLIDCVHIIYLSYINFRIENN